LSSNNVNNKVQQLLVRGYSQWDIAEKLQIDQSTVSRDIQCLRQQASEDLKSHIQERLPEEYQRCLTGLNQVLKLSWDIANKSKDGNGNDNGQTMTMTDDKTRLQALSLVNDCYKYIMD
jgi:IS30 family transposase